MLVDASDEWPDDGHPGLMDALDRLSQTDCDEVAYFAELSLILLGQSDNRIEADQSVGR